ncbi:MAG: HDOD domain-containing protein [Firmicutes bacterium]|nr:HDOD domain-containing protein [Bacillota bacterium]
MEVYVARQPVFDSRQQVFAYELLFRHGLENCYPGVDGDLATARVITDSFMLLGIDTLTNGKPAFINFTANMIKNEIPTIFPPDLIGVEILEDIELDEDILYACQKLKNSRYLLVLDDFALSGERAALAEMADIIKVDFLATAKEDRAALAEKFAGSRIKLLAEKVETMADFEEALQLGYTYFQGFFFSRPHIISRKDIPSHRLTYLRILQELHSTNPDFEEITRIVTADLSLSYKLLRLVNSAIFGFRCRISSIKHALVILGLEEIKKWITLLALSNMGQDKPDELIVNSVVRARFGELIASIIGLQNRSSEFFLMGLLSLIDAFLDRPMQEILAELPLANEIKDALTGRMNLFGMVYRLILAYEKADWEEVHTYSSRLNVGEEKIPQFFFQSVQWTNQLFASVFSNPHTSFG